MKKKVCRFLMLSGAWLMVFGLLPLSDCCAAEGENLPHLIMTTTLEDDYKTAVDLELDLTPLLKEKDAGKAFSNVLCSCVSVQVKDHYGSGSIYKMLEKEILIVTNRHVLEYWNEDSYVTFFNGRIAKGTVLGVSDHSDVGFLSVSTEAFSYDELLRFRNIRLPDTGQADEGDGIFAVDLTSEQNAPVRKEGKILSSSVFLEEFQEEMLYAKGDAHPGMSGCGIFDEFGNYLGMLTGGNLQGEIAAVPVGTIRKVYEEIRE